MPVGLDDERVHVPKPPGYLEGEEEDFGVEFEDDLSRVGMGIGIAIVV